MIFSIRERVHEVCLNSARQLIGEVMGRNRTPLRDFASDCNFYKMCNLKKVWVGLKIRRASAIGGLISPPGTSNFGIN